MCRATLFPDPDSPLTMISRIDMEESVFGFPSARLEDFLGVMVGGLFFVLFDAAVELVGQCVDGGIHILFSCFGVDLVSAHHQRGLGLVTHFLDREDAVDVNQLLEMPRDPLEFFDYIAAQRGGDFHMMTAEI